jgi:hypothetical protein
MQSSGAEEPPAEIEVIRCGKLLVETTKVEGEASVDGSKWKKRFCALKNDELGWPVLQVYKIRAGDNLVLAFQIELRAQTPVGIFSLGNKYCFSIVGEVLASFHQDERDNWVSDIHEAVLTFLSSPKFASAGGAASSMLSFDHDESFDLASVSSMAHQDLSFVEESRFEGSALSVAPSAADAKQKYEPVVPEAPDSSMEQTPSVVSVAKKRNDISSKSLSSSFTGTATGPIRKGKKIDSIGHLCDLYTHVSFL